MLFIMILQGRRGPKSAEQQRAKTQSEIKYLALDIWSFRLYGQFLTGPDFPILIFFRIYGQVPDIWSILWGN